MRKFTINYGHISYIKDTLKLDGYEVFTAALDKDALSILGKNPEQPQYILTIPGVGYKLNTFD